MKIHGILIAAGASRRLGQPKQLVSYQGKTLIQHAVDILTASDIDDYTVVLGCQADKIKTEIDQNVRILINENWEEGMGTTISKGVSSLDSEVDAVLILLVDQYRLTTDLINQLIKEFKDSNNKMIVSQYGNDVVGSPAIFPRKYFNQLTDLSGDRGAGKIIKSELKNNRNNVIVIDFEDGHLDVDIPEDLDKLIK